MAAIHKTMPQSGVKISQNGRFYNFYGVSNGQGEVILHFKNDCEPRSWSDLKTNLIHALWHLCYSRRISNKKAVTWAYYRKNSKIWDTSNNCHKCPKIGKVWCNIALMHPKESDAMANSVDPDQTASSEAVWSWSALFAETYLSQYI